MYYFACYNVLLLMNVRIQDGVALNLTVELNVLFVLQSNLTESSAMNHGVGLNKFVVDSESLYDHSW
mgnify:CR=1 FL=1